MDSNQQKPPKVFATIDEAEYRELREIDAEIRARDEQVAVMLRALQDSHVAERKKLVLRRRDAFVAITQKYKLDPNVPYELVDATRELIAHECRPDGFTVISGSDLLRALAGHSEQTDPPPDGGQTKH